MSTARLKLTKVLMRSSGKPKGQLREAAKKKSWSIVRGDKVQVVGTHPEKGKQGIVKMMIRDKDRVIVEGVNVGPKRFKANADRGVAGRTVQRERPVHYSHVNLVDPVTNKPTRIYHKFLEDGSKVRVAKKSGAIIPRPELLKIRKRPINSIVTESDTTDDDVWAVTYSPS